MSYTVNRAIERLKDIQKHHPTIGGIQEVIEMLEDPKMLLIEWGAEDVQIKAKERKAWLLDITEKEVEEKPLTDKQVAEVIELLERTHDCNYGITWEHIDSALDNLGYPEVDATRPEP